MRPPATTILVHFLVHVASCVAYNNGSEILATAIFPPLSRRWTPFRQNFLVCTSRESKGIKLCLYSDACVHLLFHCLGEYLSMMLCWLRKASSEIHSREYKSDKWLNSREFWRGGGGNFNFNRNQNKISFKFTNSHQNLKLKTSKMN